MEKIRGLYDQKRKEQKRLYYSGAEAHKLEAMEICVKKQSTKVTIAIQIVNNISKSINKLRDEELFPQTHEIVKGYVTCWLFTLAPIYTSLLRS
jgi:thermostable 8-oxoguanine DNA glycosylase